MDRLGHPDAQRKPANDNPQALTKDTLSGLQARMADQDLAIHDLERRVKALEEALRLIGRGIEP